MKRSIVTLSALCLSVSLMAQDVNIMDVKKTMSKGENPGLEVSIPKANVGDVAKVFETKMKEYKGKFVAPSKGNVEYFIDDAKISTISDQPVDIYAYILPEGENVKFTSFYSVGGLFFSPANETQYAIAKNIVAGVYKQVMFDQMDAKLKEETKKFDALESDFKGLEKAKDGFDKEIKKATETIAKSEGAVRAGESDKAKTLANIDAKKADVARQKEELAKFDRKALENEIKALEGDKKGLEKSMAKTSKEIGSKTAEIEKLKAEIATLTTQVETNKSSIDAKTRLIAEKQGTINNNNLEEKEKQLKATEKDQQGLEKDADKIAKDIEKNTAEIASNKAAIMAAESAITDNAAKQAAKKAEVEAQKAVIEALKAEQAKYK